MTKPEGRMGDRRVASSFVILDFIRHSGFVIRHSPAGYPPPKTGPNRRCVARAELVAIMQRRTGRSDDAERARVRDQVLEHLSAVRQESRKKGSHEKRARPDHLLADR